MATAAEPRACVGIVLAGGRSSRMGRDKALLVWRGRPLIDHQIETLRAAGTDPVRVSGDRHGIADSTPDTGPLGGLATMAGHLADADLLVLPVDMPCMSATLLKRLRTGVPGAACLRFEGHVLPMRLRLNAATRAALATLMAVHDDRARSLRALQDRVGVAELVVPEGEAGRFADCNTPGQWRELRP